MSVWTKLCFLFELFFFAWMTIFLLLSMPTAFLQFSILLIFLTTHPFPHPTSKNENDSPNEIESKNFETFFPCSASISSALPFWAHLSKVSWTLSMIRYFLVSIYSFHWSLLRIFFCVSCIPFFINDIWKILPDESCKSCGKRPSPD